MKNIPRITDKYCACSDVIQGNFLARMKETDVLFNFHLYITFIIYPVKCSKKKNVGKLNLYVIRYVVTLHDQKKNPI